MWCIIMDFKRLVAILGRLKAKIDAKQEMMETCWETTGACLEMEENQEKFEAGQKK
jgi:hypothetical protein